MIKNEIDYWLALKFIPRLAIHKKLMLVKTHGLAALFTHPTLVSPYGFTANQKAAFLQPNWTRIKEIIHHSALCQSDIVVFDDPDYPQLLKEIYDPPLVLFVKGNRKLLNTPQLAIVGSRSASIQGREITVDLAKQLVAQGLTITSGLALGIDAAAHRGALSANGLTIAVVATGLDKIYPARHASLTNDILQADGAVVSEFLPGTLPKAGHFPKRNRIISGLSKGVLVVEAELKSGSLITARCALEQGREVYAVPSSIANPLAKGCHWLIKQGATLVEECADIINDLDVCTTSISAPVNKVTKVQKITENNHQQDLCNDSLLASVGYEVTPIDTVVASSKLPIETVLTRLTILELKGDVIAVPGGYLRLK